MKTTYGFAAWVFVLFLVLLAFNSAKAQWTQAPGNFQVNGDLDIKGDATLGDDLTVTDAVSAADVTASDDLVVGDDAAIAGLLTFTPVSVTSAGGTAITVGAGTVILLNADALGYPITTNTVVAPSAAGQVAVIVNASTSNSVLITEGTTVDSGGNKTLGPEDVLLLFSRDTSAFSAVYHDN